MLELLARQRLAVEPQVEVLLGVSARAARDRLAHLAAGGYLRRERIFTGQPGCARITRKGLDAIGSRLPPPRLDLACYQHDVGLTWLWLAARDGTFGALGDVVSEREMRSHDARPGRERPPFGVGIGSVGTGGRERLHYPDLMLWTANGKRVAVELELTTKSRRRLEGIMLGYAGDQRIDAVLYLVPARDPGLADRIEQAAARYGIADLVHVQLLAGPPEGAPDHGRTLGRRQGRGRQSGWPGEATA